MANRFIDGHTHTGLIQWAAGVLELTSFSPDARCMAHMIQDSNGVSPLAVVVFDRWTPYSCEVSIASDKTGRWATRTFIREVYEYVFTYAKKQRMTMIVSERNARSINTQMKLGHVEEGCLRDAFGEGHNGIVFGFTTRDYLASKWHR